MIGWACARNGLLSGFFAAAGHASSVCGCGMSGADVICRRGCDLSGCGCGLSARMLAIPAAVGSAAVRKGHSGGRRQCDCTQGSFRRLSAVRLYARSIPAAVGCTIVRKEHSGGRRQCGCTQGAFRRPSAVRLYARVSPPELQYSCHLGGPHSTQMAKYNLVRGRLPTQTASNSRFRGI